MRILMALTYYRPHTSGLTVYAQRLAEALAQRGHTVTVLASRHRADRPQDTVENGVNVIRTPVLARMGKGVISPGLYRHAARLLKSHDIVLLHLPQFDCAGIALLARARGVPVVITYHCDLQLPPGMVNKVVNALVLGMHHLAGAMAQRVVAYTQDFAHHSPFLRRYAGKQVIVPPPVELPAIDARAAAALRARYNPHGQPVIGMATRFAAEKGVEILLDALPQVLRDYPRARVLFAGQYREVWGEQDYFTRLEPRIRQYRENGTFEFLGVLNQREMAAFYANLDVLVVPSLNSTESFGLVQIEAMQCGCPVIASDLPGVRQPVALTGMGKIVPIGDADALAAAIANTLGAPRTYSKDLPALLASFHPEACAAAYEDIFMNLVRQVRT